MNILVTGGAGFIGANFLNRLVPRHPEHRFINVDVLTYAGNPESLAAIADRPNYAFERVDVADRSEVDRVFETHAPDLIVHFAAESHVDRSIHGPEAFVRTNVTGTFTLLEACRRHWGNRYDGRLFLHVSTDEVFGSLGAEGRFTEDSPYDPSSPYSATKAAADHLVRAYGRTYGLPFKLTISSNNYGPFQFPEKLIPLMILNAAHGDPLPIYGRGQQVRDWLFVDDHVDAVWAVIQRGAVGATYTIGGDIDGGREWTNLEVVDRICELVARASGRDLADVRALQSFVTDRPGHDRRYAIDASKIHRELGWRPVETFESGLEKTVRWVLDHPEWVEGVRTGAYRAWIATNYTDRTDEGDTT